MLSVKLHSSCPSKSLSLCIIVWSIFARRFNPLANIYSSTASHREKSIESVITWISFFCYITYQSMSNDDYDKFWWIGKIVTLLRNLPDCPIQLISPKKCQISKAARIPPSMAIIIFVKSSSSSTEPCLETSSRMGKCVLSREKKLAAQVAEWPLET